jgi:hypothetical protein
VKSVERMMKMRVMMAVAVLLECRARLIAVMLAGVRMCYAVFLLCLCDDHGRLGFLVGSEYGRVMG